MGAQEKKNKGHSALLSPARSRFFQVGSNTRRNPRARTARGPCQSTMGCPFPAAGSHKSSGAILSRASQGQSEQSTSDDHVWDVPTLRVTSGDEHNFASLCVVTACQENNTLHSTPFFQSDQHRIRICHLGSRIMVRAAEQS